MKGNIEEEENEWKDHHKWGIIPCNVEKAACIALSFENFHIGLQSGGVTISKNACWSQKMVPHRTTKHCNFVCCLSTSAITNSRTKTREEKRMCSGRIRHHSTCLMLWTCQVHAGCTHVHCALQTQFFDDRLSTANSCSQLLIVANKCLVFFYWLDWSITKASNEFGPFVVDKC